VSTVEPVEVFVRGEPVRPRRLTMNHKTEAVLRVIRGDAPEVVADALGVEPSDVDDWHRRFVREGRKAFSPSRNGSSRNGSRS